MASFVTRLNNAPTTLTDMSTGTPVPVQTEMDYVFKAGTIESVGMYAMAIDIDATIAAFTEAIAEKLNVDTNNVEVSTQSYGENGVIIFGAFGVQQ